MLSHERRAFWKFFLTYFVSVAFVVLIAGRFYYEQMYQQMIKAEHFSLINFARGLKAGEPSKEKTFSYSVYIGKIDAFNMDNFSIGPDYFEKFVPYEWDHDYYRIRKSRSEFDGNVSRLRRLIVLTQFALLSFFALLSYFLARNALKPMQEAIIKLDTFSKDLIHDLNTPVTVMRLNVRVLENEPTLKENKALRRLQKSLLEVSELHQNLQVLLEEETFQFEWIEIDALVHEVAQTQQLLYPDLTWQFMCHDTKVFSNEKALKQILYNILSNACRYNRKDGEVNIRCEDRQIIIEDSGIGIKEPEKVFERSYKENKQGFGIGLDIVRRLCEAMDIQIKAESHQEGSRFILTFKS